MIFAAFYDANVLIPHEVRDILMISASTRLHSVYWSEDVFEEWYRNSVGQGLATGESVRRFQRIMNGLFEDAFLPRDKYFYRIDSMTNDPKDRHVLAAAVEAEVDVIVTYNIRDFPLESVVDYSIEVQTPDQFVRSRIDINPDRFISVFLRRSLERIKIAHDRGRRPITPEDIALFLRDGPALMPNSGQYILQLLGSSYSS
jgi:predicted nucleic acid-binding protein